VARPADFQGFHEVLEHRGVPSLTGSQEHDQGPLVPIDQGMDQGMNLGAQPAAGTADRVIIGLVEQILVISQVPLWCG